MTSAGAETGEPGDTAALDRSRQALGEAKEAARDALADESPTDELDVPGTGEGLESTDDGDVAPRPN